MQILGGMYYIRPCMLSMSITSATCAVLYSVLHVARPPLPRQQLLFFASPPPTPVHFRRLYARLSRAQHARVLSGSE